MSTDNVVRHVLDDGTIEYRNATGVRHREDGPAVVYSDGTKKWYLNGDLHRTDGPAVMYPDGTKWFLDGELHRTDGPAVLWTDGTELWYRNGGRHREDGPAVMYPDGTEFWFRDGNCHREDGPAVMWTNGTKRWYLNGVLHRIDGPAVVHPDGNCEYWIDGTFIIGKTIEGEYCLELDSGRLHRPHLAPELVVKVMSDKGFGSAEEFGSWLAFVVLGEEAVPLLTSANEEGTTVQPVLDEYLRNHEDYAGLPFSWWYPIVESESRQQ